MSVVLILTAVGVAVAAIGAGYGAYSASQAQAQQANAAKKVNEMNAKAEHDAGVARANQVAYNAKKLQRSFLSRMSATGADVNESGSLLEAQVQFAADESYAEQLAKYPHELAGSSEEYKADLAGFMGGQAKKNQMLNTGVAAGSTLATGASKLYTGYNSPGQNLNV